MLKDKRLCWRCLKTHGKNDCRSTWICSRCDASIPQNKKLHANVLHDTITNFFASKSTTVKQSNATQQLSICSASSVSKNKNSQVILQSVQAWLRGPNGSKQMVRILLDSGADICLIRKDVSDRSGLTGPISNLTLQVAGGGQVEKGRERQVNFKLESLNGQFITQPIEGHTMSKVVENFSPVSVDPKQFVHLENLQFTEEYPRTSSAQIDILLGEPYYSDLILGAPIRGKINEPKAILTKLGYVLAGSFNTITNAESYRVNFCSKPDLTQFWNLEHIGILPEVESNEFTLAEQKAEDLMEKVTTYDEEKKQWSTELLFKDPNDKIQNNYRRAKALMISVEKNAKKLDYVKELNATFEELIQEGFAEKVPTEEIVNENKEQVYYLQTFPVIKPERDSTKIRLVMDASAKDPGSKKSLNDLLYQGPCLLNEFVKILIQFKLHKYAFTCDISKMFLRIRLSKGTNALRFLWRGCNEEEEEKIYRMLVLAFGLNSSPYQAAWVTRKHAERFKKEFELAYESIFNRMYVDDIASGQQSLELASKEAKQIYDLLQLATMTACKWYANNKSILDEIPENLISTKSSVKVLGVQWNTLEDTINFNFIPQLVKIDIETKRSFLQQTAMLFDPLGLLAPFILQAKLLFQLTWEMNLKWDDPLPPSIMEPWINWKNQIPLLQDLKMERCLISTSEKIVKDSTIIAFGDASTTAYGCCVYLLTSYEDGSISSSLVLAKSRVNPINNKFSIVRLELLAALCASRAAVYTSKALNVKKIICFSDSMITLGRIRKGHAHYKIWVARRLEELTTLVSKDQWRFCPGKLNPSDMSSRGCNAQELINSTNWWFGPDFITTPKENWPEEETQAIQDHQIQEELTEEKKEIHISLAATRDINPIINLANKVSNWNKFVRIVCYIRRFASKTQARLTGPILVPELEKTKEVLWNISQEHQFHMERKDIGNGNKVAKDSKLAELNMFIDENHLMRSKTRLVQSQELTYDETHPIVLPNHCPIVEKFILNLHQSLGHASANYLLSLIRQQFKLLKSKQEIKRIINLCLTRRCIKGQPLRQQMAPLPVQRMDQLEPFAHCSTDLFGPMFIKHICKFENCVHLKETKVWCCIFTCLQTRGIVLEIVDDLSAEEVILALRRFITRVGLPKTMFSDNGTNFQCASKELKRLFKAINWNKVQEECSQKGIQWAFAVEAAPHTNGITERMIQSVKKHIRITIGSARLTRKHLEIVLKEAEFLVNNRPLCVVSPDENDLTPITPFQLIMGKQANLLPDPNWRKQVENPGNFTKMWKLRQTLTSQFWKQWKTDYLMKQDVRTKWQNPTHQDLLGKIVLVNDDNMAKNVWKIARIIDTVTSKDGLIRTAIIKTPTSVLRRPIQKLSLLEGID